MPDSQLQGRPHESAHGVHRSAPRIGDVVVSERTARADVYAISVVPAEAHVVAGRYAEAIETVRELARQRGVDGWYTGDQTHYVRVARYRASSDR
jgi:hypothetical protein